MVDRDFLEEIKITESEAVERVEEARRQSQAKRQAIRQQAADLVDEAYRMATGKRQAVMDDAERRYRDLIAQASAPTSPELSKLPDQEINQAAAALAERIITLLEHR